MLRWIYGATRIDYIRSEYIKGSLKGAPVVEKLKLNRIYCYGHIIKREETHIYSIMSMNVDEWIGRGNQRNDGWIVSKRT